MVRIISSRARDFSKIFLPICERKFPLLPHIEKRVRKILEEVRRGGDEALLRLARKFDGLKMNREELIVSKKEMEEALKRLDRTLLNSLRLAARRIREFHRSQIPKSTKIYQEEGILLGRIIKPIERVGIYIPGGGATYPSTILMSAIPAKIAGVKEIIMATPPSPDKDRPEILAAAAMAGLERLYRVGGAQAIGALAYGTESIPRVDKIVGPGNIYVTTAQRLVFGQVDIETLAGPTEVAIVADSSAPPDYVAYELLAQAEHDELAYPLLFSPSLSFARQVRSVIGRELQGMRRRKIIETSLKTNGLFIITTGIPEALSLASDFAPEHLVLMVKNPLRFINQIKNAGTILVGPQTPVAISDYLAGPSHILPTSGAARFSSPLGVESFLKVTHLVYFSKGALKKYEQAAVSLAEQEGLPAHAQAIRIRMRKEQ